MLEAMKGELAGEELLKKEINLSTKLCIFLRLGFNKLS